MTEGDDTGAGALLRMGLSVMEAVLSCKGASCDSAETALGDAVLVELGAGGIEVEP